MSTVNIQINGKPITVEKGTHILAAAKQAGVKIPSLCAHPDLDAWAACGICVVKVSNARGISPKLVRACATECVEGENYITHDPELNKIRRTIIEMILADHPQSCLTCGRNGSCELQTLAAEFGIREIPFARNVKNMPKDDSTGAIVLDPSKCVQCGRCAQVCQQLQNVWALEFIGRGEKTRIAGAGDIVLNETPCIKCGQCSAHCPVGAIYELDETAKLLEAIRNPELTVIAQIAPAVRVAIGEEFGMDPGEVTTGKIYAALRAIGVDTVFDTNFGADLTIMEEGTEFVRRFTENKDLPLITSCCPAWVEYMEKYACDMIPNFSTAKSPQQMQGAITKTYYAQNAGLDPKKIFSVSIMPCTAKKQEIKRSEDMFSSGCQDNDLVLTTRELARLFKQFGIDFKNIEPQEADSPIGQYTGAATIFGVTGGVMEAALRTAYYLVTKEELSEKAVDFTCGCRTTSSKSWRAKAAVLPAADSRMEQKMKFVLNGSTGSTRMIKNANSASHTRIPTFRKFTKISSESRRRIKPINFFIRITYRGRLIKSNLNATEGRKLPPLFLFGGRKRHSCCFPLRI